MFVTLDVTQYGKSLKTGALWKLWNLLHGKVLFAFYQVEKKDNKTTKDLITIQYSKIWNPCLVAVTKNQFNAWKNWKIEAQLAKGK